jgi:cholesterol oxidase
MLPPGLFDPSVQDGCYRLSYEAWLRQRNVRNVLRRIPSFMLLDDHEIDDNWEPLSSPDDAFNSEKARLGIEAYTKYQRGKFLLETFDFDGVHFFMLDTRTTRTHRKVAKKARLFCRDAERRFRCSDCGERAVSIRWPHQPPA